jgi:hypothetical protein
VCFNIMQQYTTGWVSEPDGRGTWGILYSNLFTLSLCVYSAIHLNVPAQGETSSAQFWRKTKWVLVAIVAPEVILYSAWQQYYIASRFCQDLYKIKLERAGLTTISTLPWWRRRLSIAEVFGQRLMHKDTLQKRKEDNKNNKNKSGSPHEKTEQLSTAEDDTSSPPVPLPAKFSLTYGFYVLMGGLVVDVSDIYDDVSQATLTPAGVLNLAKKTSWEPLYVPDETIRDKSKADNLGKLLVFCQVSWTLLQCISRKALGYPLTVLEVHTLVHAACGMIMYAFWFHKPLDVGDASSVDVDLSAEELALEMVRSAGSACRPFTTLSRQWQHYRPPFTLFSRQRCFMAPEVSEHGPWRQYSSLACEASFLIFDTSRCAPSTELPGASEPSVVSILQGPAGKRNVQLTADLARVEQPQYPATVLDDPGALESQMPRLPHGESAAIHRASSSKADEITVLTTGQTLSSGIGPGALLILSGLPLRLDGIEPALRALLPLPKFPGGKVPCSIAFHKVSISLSQKDLLRWDRAGLAYTRALRKASGESGTASQQLKELPPPGVPPRIKARLRLMQKVTSTKRDLMYGSHDFVLRSPNVSTEALGAVLSPDDMEGPQNELAFLCITSMALISGVYAGVHLALWNYPFPTKVERLLWRLASTTLGAPFGYAAVLLAWAIARRISEWLAREVCYRVKMAYSKLVKASNRKDKPVSANRRDVAVVETASTANGVGMSAAPIMGFRFLHTAVVQSVLRRLEQLIGMIMLWGFWGLYGFSRLYVLVEALISLRRVPAGVYQSVTWAQYIPHF